MRVVEVLITQLRPSVNTTFGLVFAIPELELNLLEGGGGSHHPVPVGFADLHHRGGGGCSLQPTFVASLFFIYISLKLCLLSQHILSYFPPQLMKHCSLSLILSLNVLYLGEARKEKRGKGGGIRRGKEEEGKKDYQRS